MNLFPFKGDILDHLMFHPHTLEYIHDQQILSKLKLPLEY